MIISSAKIEIDGREKEIPGGRKTTFGKDEYDRRWDVEVLPFFGSVSIMVEVNTEQVIEEGD